MAIIQARMGSKRLPGKSMPNLAGELLIGLFLERIKSSEPLDVIILAIPKTPKNRLLELLAERH